MTIRAISYGGGVQSTALLVLAADGRIDESMGGPVDTALFANVGDDSEHPDTLAYVREVAVPWAAGHGLTIHELTRKPTRGRFKGQTETLYQRLAHPDSSSIGIPVRMAETGAPGTRACTADFKIRVVLRWLKDADASEDDPALVAVGISTDEAHRATNRTTEDPAETITWPLLDLGISRADAAALVADAGLPVPPRSACYFCPLHTLGSWSELRRDRPDLFAKAQALEDTINTRRVRLGKDPVAFTSRGTLDNVEEAQPGLFATDWVDGDGCESGYCWT